MTTTDHANTGNNSSLNALIGRAAPQVIAAIKHASAATGVDFSYMVEKAAAESGFKPDAKSAGSSATGLFQFIDKTWMSMVKKYGDKCGLGKYADCIDEKGRVADPAMKQEILALRKSPEISAMMAAEYTTENKDYLQDKLGSGAKIGSTELYMAHFMGAGGAGSFLKAYRDTPLAPAADLFPKAANANRNIFYDSKTGEARSLAGVYDLLAKKFDAGSGGEADSAVRVASAGTGAATSSDLSPTAYAARAMLDQMDPAGAATAAVSSSSPLSPIANDSPLFLPTRGNNFSWLTGMGASSGLGGLPGLSRAGGGALADPVHVMMMAQKTGHQHGKFSSDNALSRHAG